MGRPVIRPRDRIEDRFDLHDGAVPGQREALRATQYKVTDRRTRRDGSLKLWRKTGTTADDDLRGLWAHEMRQVQRVLSHAGARDVIVGIAAFVEDDDEFGILLDHPGQTLSAVRRLRNHWVRGLADPAARTLLWRNVRRLARALSIIHGQGLIHGAVNGDAVMTESGTEPDFQLTGFEWSLHVKGEAAAVGGKVAERVARYSFSGDWNALGQLAADLLDVRVAATGEVTHGPDAANLHLGDAEVALLRQLVNPVRDESLDAEDILRAVDEAASSTAAGSLSGTARLLLCFALRSGLSEAVTEVTEGGIAIDEFEEQLGWVRGELGGGARLVVTRSAGSPQFRLFTANLVLSLSASAGPDGASVWTAANCWKVEVRTDVTTIGDVDEHDLHVPIEVVDNPNRVGPRRAALGPAALDWRDLVGPVAPGDSDPTTARVQDALVLAQVADAIVQALESHPVDVIASKVDVKAGRRHVLIRATAGSQRDAFAKGVKLGSSQEALTRMFADDERVADGKWRLSRSSMLGARTLEDVPASFFDLGEDEGRPGYWFEVDDEVPSGGQWFLRPETEAGTVDQILRRLRAIKALGERADLGRMLGDPWRERRTNGAVLDGEGDERFEDLDEAKQRALVALWTTEPSFFVVGPPGVGKTHLLTEVVRRRFSAEPPPRILLTAQGHDALDHLQGKVRTALDASGHGDAILVRSDAAQRSTPHDATLVARSMLERLATSSLVAAAPPPLAEKARRLARLANTERIDLDEDRSALRAATGTVMSAADVVVTTVNSGDVGRLVESRDQFDWVIVEEAAKVTGPEMTGPLMLSSRRLLIGDHNQLSPFGADHVRLLLADHALVAEALRDAERWIGDLMRSGELDELAEVATDDARLKETADLAARLAVPFEAYVTEDERRSKGPNYKPISAVLTEQRRMDPAIARVVSKAFYGGKLVTAEKREKEAVEDAPACECLGTLPASPIVIVECGHVSGTGSEEPSERSGPRYHNPGEVAAVLGVVERLRGKPDEHGRPPSLAVLSFYGAQVDKLDGAIAAAQGRGRLPGLSSFRPAVRGKYVGTVDAFQGQEADVVILSLVRNNPRTGTGALGFLRESRRMNVALSRAEGKLVIVGSLKFLREAARGVNPRGRPHDLSFLTRVVDAVSEETKETSRPGVPCAVEISPEDLFAEPPAC